MEVILSVIIPVYNTKKYLRQCVQSVQSQLGDTLEIILVDDASPDQAGELCDVLALEDSRIRVIHKQNEGLGMARNSGLDIALGKYVAFVDSDDFVEDGLYRSFIALCEKYSCDLCVAGGCIQYSEKGSRSIAFDYKVNTFLDSNELIHSLIPNVISSKPETNDNISASAWMTVYKRDFLTRHSLRFISEREFISEDLWFAMDCMYHAGSIYYSSIIGYNYRYNPQSLSRRYNPGRFELLHKSVCLLLDKCRAMNLEDYFIRTAMYYWVNFEKCINQEIRFQGFSSGMAAIKKMCKDELSRELLSALNANKGFGGMHGLLCSLICHNQYLLIWVLLKIYNRLKHQ